MVMLKQRTMRFSSFQFPLTEQFENNIHSGINTYRLYKKYQSIVTTTVTIIKVSSLNNLKR